MNFTSADLLLMPDDGKRYEVIDGELFVSDPSNWYHQSACGHVMSELSNWNDRAQPGVANTAPGLIFTEYDDVALTSPLLSGFTCQVSKLFHRVPEPYEDAQKR
jgi:type VI protein secretion system component Hcp